MTVAHNRLADSETLITELSERPRRHVPPGGRLFHEGEPPVEAFFIHDGLVKLVKTAKDGTECVLEFRAAGWFVGECSVVLGVPQMTSGVAATPLAVTSIPREQLLAWIRRDADLASTMLTTFARSVRNAVDHVVGLRAADAASLVTTRLTELVLDPAFGSLRVDRDGAVDIEMPMTQEELASWAGVSHRSVANVLQQLRADDLIATSRHHLVVRDPAELAKRCAKMT